MTLGDDRDQTRPTHERIAASCAQAGLDLIQPFDAAHYNHTAKACERLPDFDRPSCFGLLIGNTRALWPRFTSALAADPELARDDNPLDRYVRQRLLHISANATSAATRLVFAHDTSPRPFPIQRLAEQVGMAWLSPSHLAIHPLHGLWFALRAVLLVDLDAPVLEPSAATRPCDTCSAPCVAALERALAASGTPLDSAAIRRHSADWIAVRDACPVGRASRYGQQQLRYHYAPSRRHLPT